MARQDRADAGHSELRFKAVRHPRVGARTVGGGRRLPPRVCRHTSIPRWGRPMGEEVALYGTIAKMKLKPGSEDKMMQAMDGTTAHREGHVATYVFKSDADPNVHFVTTVFESKSAYKKFADSPEQTTRFQQLRELLAA